MVFIPTSVYVENAQTDFNALPPPREQRGPYWSLVSGLLGLQSYGDEVDYVDPAIQAVRRRDARIVELNRAPSALEAVVTEALDHVIEAVGKAVKVTRIDLAKAFLLEKLGTDGSVAQRDIQEQGKLAGHTLKNLTIGKQRLGVRSFKKGGKWWWTLGQPAKMDG